jgi:hypothetical protein
VPLQKFARETGTILQQKDDLLKKLDSTNVGIDAVQMLSAKLKSLQGDLERITTNFVRSRVDVDVEVLKKILNAGGAAVSGAGAGKQLTLCIPMGRRTNGLYCEFVGSLGGTIVVIMSCVCGDLY